MYKKIKKCAIGLLLTGLFLPKLLTADMIFYYSAAILPSIVAQQGSFKYTTEWLNGRTLYNVYEEENEWVITVFDFTDTEWSAYMDNNTSDRVDDIAYEITVEGYITFIAPWDNQDIEYIKVVSETEDYQKLLWTNNFDELVMDTWHNEYFYFNHQKAKDFVDSQNGNNLLFTQSIVSRNSWYVVEYEQNVAYCNGVFTYDGNGNVIVEWDDNGTRETFTGTYAIENGGVVTVHDGKTDTETIQAYTQEEIMVLKKTIRDDGSTKPDGNKKWFKIQSDAESFLSSYGESSCF